MPLAPLSTWRSTFKTMVVPTVGVDGPIKLGMWIASNITNKPALQNTTVISPSFTCVWDPSPFISLMTGIPPSLSSILYATKLSQAWAASTQASILSVPSGASVGPPTPATTFSAPPIALFNPASVAAGIALILAKVSTAPAVPDSDQSVTVQALYEATKQLTVTITGLNSIPTPAGPLPLIVPACPIQ